MAGGWSGRLRLLAATYWLLVLWLGINFAIFWSSYSGFKKKPQHVYLRNMIGRGLCISKATAAILNLSCCLVLLPVSRSLHCLLHRLLGWLSRPALTFWLERAKVIHMGCAVTIVVTSVVHTVAHIINAINFTRFYDHEHPQLNWAEYENQHPAERIFTSVAGLTGVAMVLLLVLLTATSLRWVRRHYYRLFWSSHWLFLPFLLLLLCHPLSGALKELANPQTHMPGCIMPSTANSTNLTILEQDTGGHSICTSGPIFVPMKSLGWVWVVVPLALYAVDQAFRVVRRNWTQLIVVQATRLPGAAIRLRLLSRSTTFICHPGQYILLQCPVISTMEWHPFSIASCPTPGQPSFTVLIRARGDWTEELLGRVLVPFSHSQQSAELCRWPSPAPVRFLVDGPFCSPLEGVLHCRVAVCIAAGAGVTPFAGTIQYLLSSRILPEWPKRIHLVWLVRDAQQLAWFSPLLCDALRKFWTENQPDRLEIRLHLTRGFSLPNIQKALGDEIGLLGPRLWRGRPNWNEAFHQWNDMYNRQQVSVFTCGPKSLTRDIRQHCAKANRGGATFHYTHEAFS